MKRRNLRTWKDYDLNAWRVQGRRNGIWLNAEDSERVSRGLPAELIFDFEYDACGYLWGYMEWSEEQQINSIPSLGKGETRIDSHKYLEQKRIAKKKKRKEAAASRRRNR